MTAAIELSTTVGDVGEKWLIENVVRPEFDLPYPARYIGDDCALLQVPDGEDILASTDRVPADLTAFRLGLLGYGGLGRYLAVLNLSDIASCGGRPVGLLLNLGLPQSIPVSAVREFCIGFHNLAASFGARVVGGDITSSSELSVSATSLGTVPRGAALRRCGARPGDVVFLSRPLGLTPAAFKYFLSEPHDRPRHIRQWEELFTRQFTSLEPMLHLGARLRESGQCSACMDNTDGVAQSLLELAQESQVQVVVDEKMLRMHTPVLDVAGWARAEPGLFAMGPGADFSLIGALRPTPASDALAVELSLEIIGRVEGGSGVQIATPTGTKPLQVKGWDYFRTALLESSSHDRAMGNTP